MSMTVTRSVDCGERLIRACQNVLSCLDWELSPDAEVAVHRQEGQCEHADEPASWLSMFLRWFKELDEAIAAPNSLEEDSNEPAFILPPPADLPAMKQIVSEAYDLRRELLYARAEAITIAEATGQKSNSLIQEDFFRRACERLRLLPPVEWNRLAVELDRDAVQARIAGAIQQSALQQPEEADNNHSDGPARPNLLWWKNSCHELQPRLWSLLDYLWDKDTVEVTRIEEDVWREDVADSTIKAAISNLNKKLLEAEIPWSYAVKQGYIIKNKM